MRTSFGITKDNQFITLISIDLTKYYEILIALVSRTPS